MGGVIALPQRHLTQPQYAARVDFGHRLMQGAGYVFSAAGGQPVIQTRTLNQQFGDPDGGRIITPKGRGYGSANTYLTLDDAAAVQSTGDPHTIFGVWRQVDAVNGNLAFGQSNNSLPNTIRLWCGGTPQYEVYLGGYRALSADSAPAAGSIYAFAGVNTGTAQYTLLNGKRQTATGSFSGGALGAGYTGFALANNPGYATLLFGVIFRGVVPDGVIAELGANPWQVFKAPSRKIWIASAASGSAAGSAAGLAAATGVGASIASSVGSSSGLAAGPGVGAATASSVGSSSGLAAASATGASIASTAGSSSGIASASGVGTSSTGSSGSASGISTVSGVGSSTADSVGSSSGTGSASGVGASASASIGSSAGVATVSGVGDSSIPGSTVGSASGSSSVSGAGASVASAAGSASGSSSAVAVSDNGSLSQGGDDFPDIVIEKRRKKTLAEQPNLHLQSIIDKAARGVFGENEPRPILKLNKTKELPAKEAALVPAQEVAASPEVIAAEAEKVAALLAQYQEQVKRREMEEDEELLILIMGAF